MVAACATTGSDRRSLLMVMSTRRESRWARVVRDKPGSPRSPHAPPTRGVTVTDLAHLHAHPANCAPRHARATRVFVEAVAYRFHAPDAVRGVALLPALRRAPTRNNCSRVRRSSIDCRHAMYGTPWCRPTRATRSWRSPSSSSSSSKAACRITTEGSGRSSSDTTEPAEERLPVVSCARPCRRSRSYGCPVLPLRGASALATTSGCVSNRLCSASAISR